MAEDVKVPEGWKRVRLGEVAEILTGATPLRERREYWDNGTIPWLTNEEVEEGKINYIRDTKEKITEVALKRTNVKLIPEDSVILSLTASVGKVGINKVKMTTNQQFNALVVNKQKVLPLLLGYYLVFSKERIKMLGGLTTFDFIGKTTISDFQITLPPLPEQRKIAEILETIDNAIEKTGRIIEKYKRIKQGLMQDLLTRGIDENGQIRSEETHRFRDSPLGRIPEEWKVVELGEVCEINPEKVEYSSIKIVKYIDIESVKDGKITTYKIFTKNNAPSRAQRLVKEKDIIVSTVRPNLKSFAIVTKEFDNFVCSTGFAVLRAKEEKVHPTYLFYLTFYDDVFLAQILPIIVGSNYPAINSYDVYELIIPLPPLPEQKRIASILSQIDEAIEKEQKYKEKLERIKRGLMEDLLTGKVRVNHLIEEGVELPQEA